MTVYDAIIRDASIYDGTGTDPYYGDIAVEKDRIADVGSVSAARARIEIDAADLAAAPGFINMMSWANETLIEDGRSQSDIRQGVTLEVLGEGFSMGPLTETMKAEMVRQQGDIRYDVSWTTLAEYLNHLVRLGVSTNIASFVGCATLRVHELGYENRQPSATELQRMLDLAARALEEGAVGVSSALIYAPSTFAGMDELVALAKVAARYDCLYSSHIRNEGNDFLEAVDEFLGVLRQSGARGEIYHLKASGKNNWGKMDKAIASIEEARNQGICVTADMYNYSASSTGLDTTMPPWVKEGGHNEWVRRLRDPQTRQRVIREMSTDSTEWDNGYLAAGSPNNILLIGFKNPALKRLSGKTLAEIAADRGASPEETAIDLVIEDDSDVGAVFFCMSDENIHKQLRQPWVSFCSDGRSLATEGVFLKRGTHPRAYGSFARLLAKYVRTDKVITLQEAVRRLTSLPADNLRLLNRGRISPGYYADIVIFDPGTIQDHATYEQPHQYATGVTHVLVNGVPVLRNGRHTGNKPGRVIHGPGLATPAPG